MSRWGQQQPSYGQPQYAQPQYAQPQQPQYGQAQYGQPQQAYQQQPSRTQAVLREIPGYRDPQRVSMEVDQAIANCPTLEPKVGVFTANTGAQTQKLQLDGLVPINFKGATYNIPVCIWIEQDHPQRAPTGYVKPVAGMMIVQRHQHVGSDGQCYFPYCNQWQAGVSNVIGLVNVMRQTFSAHPPVVAAPPGATTPPVVATPAPVPAPAYGSQVPAPIPAPAYQQPAYQQPSNQASQKQHAVNLVTEQMQKKIQQQHMGLSRELDELTEMQNKLRAGAEQIQEGLSGFETEKQQLQARLQWVQQENEELRTWLAQNPETVSIDPDTIIVPSDPQSQQLLELEVEDAAIEDTIYELGRAYTRAADDDMDGALGAYLKQVRSLAKKQFMAKAHKNKIISRRGGGS